jgi:hypothetical protein
MNVYNLPSGDAIDLDQVLQVGALFVNKNYPEYNSYEIYLTNGTSYGIFENALTRANFISAWSV